MNAITAKTFSLLKRVAKQCDQQSLPYFLGFRTAAYSLLDELPDNISHFEILMFHWDIGKLVESIKAWDDIKVEAIQSYQGMTDLSTFITCTSSTCVDLHHVGANSTLGCAVIVTPIADRRPFDSYRQYYIWRRWQQVRNAMGWYNKPSLLTKKLIRRTSEMSHSDDAPMAYLWRWRYREKVFERSYFSKHEYVNLNGTNFCVPENVLDYCGRYYAPRTLETLYGPQSKIYILQFAEIPFIDVQVQSSFWMLFYKMVDYALKKLVRKKMRYIQRAKNYYFRTISRFEMTRLYQSKKDACQNAYETSDWNALGELLQPYLEETRRFFKMRIPFGFDMEFYLWLMEYLKNSEKEEEILTYMSENQMDVQNYLDYVNSYGEGK